MINFGSSLATRVYGWTAFKAVLRAKKIVHQWDFDASSGTHTIYALEAGAQVHLCQLFDLSVADNIGGLDTTQNAIDLADFVANYQASANAPINPTSSDGRARVAVEKSDSTEVKFYSHDWTDKTTWYPKAAFVQGGAATDSGDHLTYALAHTFVIDTYHGNLTGEDFYADDSGRSFRVSVYVNGVKKVEQDPHLQSGGDYTVDYVAGSVTFFVARDPAEVVTADYHYATTSEFIVKPAAGKALHIDFAEVQFSDDVVLKDTAVFQPYGFVEVFAPQYCTTNGGPYPPGTKIPLGNPLRYKTISDYQNDAVRSYPVYPTIGGSGIRGSSEWRGSVRPTFIMDFDYKGEKVLLSSMGMEIRVSLQHDVPYDGYYATATFYCLSHPE